MGRTAQHSLLPFACAQRIRGSVAHPLICLPALTGVEPRVSTRPSDPRWGEGNRGNALALLIPTITRRALRLIPLMNFPFCIIKNFEMFTDCFGFFSELCHFLGDEIVFSEPTAVEMPHA
ncbi:MULTISPECIES: hypothetical protein [unclassified Rhizobium]|uniref:hypothetical protein n=1 Tax=unclassified Rhizobium TaxID=2613769 RepID=UPI0007EBB1E7|nr:MULTISPECIES: hypothetical protein [unclassified Rhizobium]